VATFISWGTGSRFPGGSRSWSDWAKGVSVLRRPHDCRGARDLGIGTETFRKWIRQDEADRGERDDRLTRLRS
jgi:hypothetical protein